MSKVERVLSEFDSRARSTKTRIETLQVDSCSLPLRRIREQDPLKQGLKLDT